MTSENLRNSDFINLLHTLHTELHLTILA